MGLFMDWKLQSEMCLEASSWALWQQPENLMYSKLAWYSKQELRTEAIV